VPVSGTILEGGEYDATPNVSTEWLNGVLSTCTQIGLLTQAKTVTFVPAGNALFIGNSVTMNPNIEFEKSATPFPIVLVTTAGVE